MTALTSTSPFAPDAPLRALAHQLDPAPARLDLARDRYSDLGDWLKEHGPASVDRDIQVYPQGSFNLGTTNQDPFTTEFDIDLVLRVAYLKEEISQRQLNEIVNGLLGSYVSVRRQQNHPLAPMGLRKGKRAWTLSYDDHFHMDALPVVPATLTATTSVNHDRSWLTDKELTLWQPTNPRGFAAWFRDRIDQERRFLTKAEVQVHDLPDAGPRSVLQMAIKLLKRHRDYYFADDSNQLAPPSAIITALAARAYEHGEIHGEDLAHALTEIVPAMPRYLLPRRSGHLWVANPRCDDENYADRYTGDLPKERALRFWLSQAAEDFGAVTTARGLQVITKAIDGAFGEGLGHRVAAQLGAEGGRSRAVGTVSSTATGLLTVAAPGSRPHRKQDFFGR